MQEAAISDKTQLPCRFTFWFTYFQKSKDKQMEEFQDNLRKIADFDSAEEFWGIYQHMKRPSTLPRGCEFFLFKEGIKPLWEDEANFGGGRLFLSMKKDTITNKVWEDLQIAMIIGGNILPFLCGSVINIRTSEVFISVWIKECSDEKREEIKEWLKSNLDLPNTNCIRWKKHPTTEQVKEKMLALKAEAEAQKAKQEAIERKKLEEQNEGEEAEGEAKVEEKPQETDKCVEKSESVPVPAAQKNEKEEDQSKKEPEKPLSQIEDDDQDKGEWGL